MLTEPSDFREGKRTAASGQEAIHVHTCQKGQHTWLCNSSYCGLMIRECPEHGGKLPRHDEGET
jgi:hypothetical protein